MCANIQTAITCCCAIWRVRKFRTMSRRGCFPTPRHPCAPATHVRGPLRLSELIFGAPAHACAQALKGGAQPGLGNRVGKSPPVPSLSFGISCGVFDEQETSEEA